MHVKLIQKQRLWRSLRENTYAVLFKEEEKLSLYLVLNRQEICVIFPDRLQLQRQLAYDMTIQRTK